MDDTVLVDNSTEYVGSIGFVEMSLELARLLLECILTKDGCSNYNHYLSNTNNKLALDIIIHNKII